MGVLWGGAVSYERGTPVGPWISLLGPRVELLYTSNRVEWLYTSR
jgi:hypothetical protein